MISWKKDTNYCSWDGLTCDMATELADSIGNLKLLGRLMLGYSQFVGPVPASLGNLTQLTLLHLMHNNFSSHIPSSLSNLVQLTCLDLSGNSFVGEIPDIVNLTQVSFFDLSNNQLAGPVPSHEKPYMFAKLIKLKYLYISHNSLSLGTTFKIDIPFPKFSYLSLFACNISAFPSFLRTQDKLFYLDLSESKIDGQIPRWISKIGKDSLSYLNLSHNFITKMKQISWKNLGYLDLRSNLLQGPLPVPPSSLRVILISNNQFTGEIIHSICDIIALDVLDLSNNRLSGTIPECIGNFSPWLSVSLNLNNNELEGANPQSLVNCTKLEVLDIGNNKINDVFPYWLGNLPELRVLVLRSNKLRGSVRVFEPEESFHKLRILDLSINNFSGYLPARFFEKLNAMRNVGADEGKLRYLGEEYYQDSVVVTLKGTEIELQKILTVFTTIDFSSNGFDGEISQVIGKLHSLRLLNLTHNHFIGKIPSSLGNLAKLESLDLSSNNLAGKIPKQLASLTSLSVLNISHNRLDGPIPQGPQFNTIQEDSYIGNLGLCGFSLTKKYGNDEAPTTFHEEEEEEEAESSSSWFDWKFAKIGYGSGLVIGMSIGYMVFASGEPLWFMKMVVTWQSKKSVTVAPRHSAVGIISSRLAFADSVLIGCGCDGSRSCSGSSAVQPPSAPSASAPPSPTLHCHFVIHHQSITLPSPPPLPGAEARKTKPGPGTCRAQARTGHAKAGFCLGPGFNFLRPIRSQVAPNPDRTRGFAKPTCIRHVRFKGLVRHWQFVSSGILLK
ncbi:Receptor-like protein 47 [Citrus sinensis]|nr:Receptor-like protein 47 [Citrus sinensis]